uniref:hypothetical protein n=1 Tax=Sinorhizobium sp. LM21 TaxID=1449788 RepID=UPI00117BC410|nr:hypothetical protein [Sinorhizobium sp. LM21]
MKPGFTVKIISAPEKPKSLWDRFEAWFNGKEPVQAEETMKRVEEAATIWEIKPFTDTMVFEHHMTATWKAADPRIPWSPSGVILQQYPAEEWNDMEESEREDAILEWQKLNGLASLGIKAPEPDPQEAHVLRMAKQAKAEQLARDMLAHKRKLEEQLKEAAAQDEHYETIPTFGAF